ncbi:thioredoxin family protein [Litoribacter alkaliphilus]|uniref:Thioredoxin family protein n=1 Tax=Litoribacter ruber TaxID=702568 RepID=A0AAP2G4C7_9BACT|nr:thioredoxin family protein [Litoribacter alkaliphilus]MBS9523911.1 thioredoxin family protein [Litoribacter alkaliphilus]
MRNMRFLMTMLLALVFTGAMAQKSGYQIGDTARDFELKNVDGETVSMADHEDAKGFLVIFSCNTCPYVVAYEDRMMELHEKYAPKGYPVIAINPNDEALSPGDSFEKMQERARDKNFPFAYVYDESQEIVNAYGATRTPEVYLLQKQDDELVVKYIGAIDNNYRDASEVTERYVEEAVDALLDDRQIAETSTKAIGCTIKFRK